MKKKASKKPLGKKGMKKTKGGLLPAAPIRFSPPPDPVRPANPGFSPPPDPVMPASPQL